MYRPPKKITSTPSTPGASSVTSTYNDLLVLTPQLSNCLAWPSIFLFDNEITVVVKGNFYELGGLRGSRRFVGRNSCENA
jgi:hypothetical protein